MGIPFPLIEFFLQEHRFRPWAGKLLTLGRQTVLADAKQLQGLLRKHGISWEPGKARYDARTVQAKQDTGRPYVDDVTLFSSFSDATLDVMDVTDYEGANVIHNLCMPIPETLAGKYDLIFNGSVLDNIFDPAGALRNITRMLSPTGRVIHIEMASNLAFECLMYSTDWFTDYYVVNGFADCRVYVCLFGSTEQLLHGPWQIYAYRPKPDGTGFQLRSLPYKQAVLVVIAEKQASSTHDRVPVQWCYRDESARQGYADALAKLSDKRPVFGFSRAAQQIAALKPGGFVECGKAGISP
jgi:hypothetical protein